MDEERVRTLAGAVATATLASNAVFAVFAVAGEPWGDRSTTSAARSPGLPWLAS